MIFILMVVGAGIMWLAQVDTEVAFECAAVAVVILAAITVGQSIKYGNEQAQEDEQ